MTLAATYTTATTVQIRSARAEPRRIKNVSNFNTLGSGRGQPEHLCTELSTGLIESDACQIGTLECAPLWHGPMLRPAFVAQVLGQVMMNRPDRANLQATLSYRHRAPRISLSLFDVRI